MTSTYASVNGDSKPKALLEPLPSLNPAPNGEKLDAGLRSLDHCKLAENQLRMQD